MPKLSAFIPISQDRPRLGVFHILTEEGVAAMFLRTARSDIDAARAYVSKYGNLDLDAIQEILGDLGQGEHINLEKFDRKSSRGKKTRSVMLKDCILHLHMIEEPDQFGPWKIYGVDKEPR